MGFKRKTLNMLDHNPAVCIMPLWLPTVQCLRQSTDLLKREVEASLLLEIVTRR